MTDAQMPESVKVPEELAAIRELCIGSVEWRCCTEDGAYCMSFDRDNSLNPEREANEWLEKHQRDHPHRFMAYKVRRVVVQSQLQEEALALITSFSALQSALKDRDAEIERLKKDAEHHRQLFNFSKLGHEQQFAQCQRLSGLLRRSLAQLGKWQRTYGEHNPAWLPPAGDVELAEDIDAAIDSMKGDANADQA